MNCLRSIVVILTCERKLINVSGILSLALPPEVNLANVLLDGSTSNISISVSTGPRVPGRNQWIFQQVLVREFVFVLFLFLVLTFDFWREFSKTVGLVFSLFQTFGDPVATADSI